MTPLELKKATGCGIELCKQAVKYSNANGGGDDMAMAYLKAKSFPVKIYPFDKKVKQFVIKKVIK